MGCGWCPSMEKVEALNAIDYQNDSDSFTLCARCFHQFSLPEEFRLGGAMTPSPKQDPQPQDSSESASSGSLTDDSVETASEAEKVTYKDLDNAPIPKDTP